MKTRLVRFNTIDGLAVQGLLFEPEKKTNKCVVHIHGSAGNFYENNFIDNFSKFYTDKDISFLVFNNRGSEFYKVFAKFEKGKKTCPIVGMLNEVFEDCVFDIESAINFAKQNNYDEIILQGHSLGCNKVIYYAFQKEFNGKIILLAPCDLVKNNLNMDYAKARGLIKSGEGSKTLPGFWNEWNISANTLVSVWGDNTNADMFRYRDEVTNKNLIKLKNDILIEIGTNDNSCVGSFDVNNMVSYLKKSFANANLTINLVEGGNHHYVKRENIMLDGVEKFIQQIK